MSENNQSNHRKFHSSRGARKNQSNGSSRTQGSTVSTKDNIGQQQRKSKTGSQVQNNQVPKTPNSPVTSSHEEHVPLQGFNAAEVETYLAKGVDPKATSYKADTVGQEKKSSPWGAKPGAMANGRDFFVELRKQITLLQQSGGVSQGG